MTILIEKYLDRLASQHADKPRLRASITAAVEPIVAAANAAISAAGLHDVELAVGRQLDVVGQWVGVTRTIAVPITGVFFAWDESGVGWDEGAWQAVDEASNGITHLDDDHYRLLIFARILNNHWDGSIEGAYAIADALLSDYNSTIVIEDHGDLSMSIGFIGSPDAVTLAMLFGGYLDIKPAGVRIANRYASPSPIFAWGPETQNAAGWGSGNWFTIT